MDDPNDRGRIRQKETQKSRKTRRRNRDEPEGERADVTEILREELDERKGITGERSVTRTGTED